MAVQKLGVLAIALLHSTSALHMILPWMCLERCGDNATDIAAQVNQFKVNGSVINAVAFEDYNLGENSQLIKNNLTQVAKPLKTLGLPTWAMVSSYPYPPQFLLWMRQVFANPQPFISACKAAAAAESLTGFNIDWEPVTGSGAPVPTPQDSADYAAFLTTFSDAMHTVGVQTSVDVASWSPLWNYTAIGLSSVDYVMNMATYTDNWTAWQTEFQYAMKTIPQTKLVVGLQSVKASNNQPYSDAELKLRFDVIQAAGVTQLGIWKSGIPDNWWQFLNAVADN